MTFGELAEEADNCYHDRDNLKKECLVYFDFPIHGVAKKYKIVKVSEAGIMLYNDEVTRPVGQE